jgi:hypothetical protein
MKTVEAKNLDPICHLQASDIPKLIEAVFHRNLCTVER